MGRLTHQAVPHSRRSHAASADGSQQRVRIFMLIADLGSLDAYAPNLCMAREKNAILKNAGILYPFHLALASRECPLHQG